MDTTRLRVGPPCTRDQRPTASLDTVRHQQRSSEKRGHISRTGSLTEGGMRLTAFLAASARYCPPPSKLQRTREGAARSRKLSKLPRKVLPSSAMQPCPEVACAT